jgi:hypothetical protein
MVTLRTRWRRAKKSLKTELAERKAKNKEINQAYKAERQKQRIETAKFRARREAEYRRKNIASIYKPQKQGQEDVLNQLFGSSKKKKGGETLW